MRTAVVYNFLLEASLMASIAIILMIPIRKFLRKPLGNRVIYFAWLLVALRLLCPLALPNPAIADIRSVFAPDTAIRPIAGQIQVRFTDAAQDITRWIEHTAGRDSGIADRANAFVDSTYNGMLSLHLMQLYLIGAGLVACWFIFANIRFRRRLKADRIEPISGKLLEQYQAMCTQRGVKAVPVYFTDPLPSACLVGVFRPYIALPLTAKPQDVLSVLTHEVCHRKSADPIWGLVRLLCCVVHWFNPLVWIAAHMSRTDSELACDDRVISKFDQNQRLAYANVLVLAASRRTAPGVAVLATSMTMTGRTLKNRVNAIIHSHTIRKGLALVFVILACMALVGAFATAEYAAALDIPQISSSDILARPITSDDDALAYAKALWASDYLLEDTEGLPWSVEEYEGTYYVNAGEEEDQLSVHIKSDGTVSYLYNGISRFDYGLQAASLYEDEADALAMYLIDFVDAMHPGASDRIEAFRYESEITYHNSRYATLFGLSYDEELGNTHVLFVVELSPQFRVVDYINNIPASTMDDNNGVG